MCSNALLLLCREIPCNIIDTMLSWAERVAELGFRRNMKRFLFFFSPKGGMCSIKEVRILLGMLGGGENEKQQYLQCLVYLLILLEFFCALRQYKVMKKKKERSGNEW